MTAATALALAVTALGRGGSAPLHGGWYLIDGATGVFLAVIAIVGLCSALVSPTYLRTSGRSWLSAARSHAWYYVALYLFWGALLAVPISGNLALAWLLVEATTATTALLIAFTGRPNALEAGWKYLVLTTLGLSVALLGIVVLAIAQAGVGHPGVGALDWHALEARRWRPAPADHAAGLRAHPCRSGGEDRLGAGPQLVARRAQRGTGADQRAPVGRAAADRAAGGLAREGHARRRGRRRRRRGVVHRFRAGLR